MLDNEEMKDNMTILAYSQGILKIRKAKKPKGTRFWSLSKKSMFMVRI